MITNCGFGSGISKKAILLSRLSSAHSTLTINDTSIIKFNHITLVDRDMPMSLKNRFLISDTLKSEDDIFLKIRASHNGYEKEFGCSHKREISLNKNNYSLFGMDEIIKNNHDKKIKFNIYFHLFLESMP